MAAVADGPELTERERQVLGLLQAGMVWREVGDALGFSVQRVGHVVRQLRRKGVTVPVNGRAGRKGGLRRGR